MLQNVQRGTDALHLAQNKRCNEWPQAAKDAGMFCDTAGAKGCVNSYFKGYCSLSSYSSDLPSCEFPDEGSSV